MKKLYFKIPFLSYLYHLEFSFLLSCLLLFSSSCSRVVEALDYPRDELDMDTLMIKDWFVFMCSPELGGRYSGSEGILRAKDYICDIIGETNSLEIDPFATDKCEMNNIIFHIKGTNDSVIVLGAHYDAFGYINNSPLPGADDNMSGVAVLLEFIKCFQRNRYCPNYCIDICFFDGEEIGRYGSNHYLSKCDKGIKEYINLDTCGNKNFGVEVMFDITHPFMESESNEYMSLVQGINMKTAPYIPKGYTTDCEPFQKKMIPFFAIHNDSPTDYLHSKRDDVSHISYERIYRIAEGLTLFLR